MYMIYCLSSLSRDEKYGNVNSGAIFRKGYSNIKETVAKTEPQQPNNAVSSGSSLSTDEQGGKSSIEPNGEPTVSNHKVTNSESDKQETGPEGIEKESGSPGQDKPLNREDFKAKENKAARRRKAARMEDAKGLT